MVKLWQCSSCLFRELASRDMPLECQEDVNDGLYIRAGESEGLGLAWVGCWVVMHRKSGQECFLALSY